MPSKSRNYPPISPASDSFKSSTNSSYNKQKKSLDLLDDYIKDHESVHGAVNIHEKSLLDTKLQSKLDFNQSSSKLFEYPTSSSTIKPKMISSPSELHDKQILNMTIKNEDLIEQELNHFLNKLKKIRSVRSFQLKQMLQAIDAEFEIENQFTSESIEHAIRKEKPSEEEFQSFLLGENTNNLDDSDETIPQPRNLPKESKIIHSNLEELTNLDVIRKDREIRIKNLSNQLEQIFLSDPSPSQTIQQSALLNQQSTEFSYQYQNIPIPNVPSQELHDTEKRSKEYDLLALANDSGFLESDSDNSFNSTPVKRNIEECITPTRPKTPKFNPIFS